MIEDVNGRFLLSSAASVWCDVLNVFQLRSTQTANVWYSRVSRILNRVVEEWCNGAGARLAQLGIGDSEGAVVSRVVDLAGGQRPRLWG
jgi:hypothetical protein